TVSPGELPHLADLALPDDLGELAPAGALVLPDAPAAQLLDPDEFAPVHPELLQRWGPGPLTAVGVVHTLGVARAADVDLAAPPDELADLDGFTEWAGRDGGTVAELVVIRDLEYVRDWRRALPLLAGDPVLRPALTDPVRVLELDGRVTDRRSYTAWWIRRHVEVNGARLGVMYDPDAPAALAAVLDAPPEWLRDLDPVARRAVGLVTEVADLDPAG